MIKSKHFIAVILLCASACIPAQSQTAPQTSATNEQQSEVKPDAKESSNLQPQQPAPMKESKIPAGSKIYIAPMEGGFENFVIAGIQKKDVAVVVVMDRSKADYEMSGIAESEKAGWAKMLFLGSQQSREQASIKVVDLKTGGVVYGYSVNKGNSYKGKQSAGEACAKHLKEAISAK